MWISGYEKLVDKLFFVYNKAKDTTSDSVSGSNKINTMGENQENLISLQEASKLSPYSVDYLRLIIRKRKLEGIKKDGKWFTTRKAIESYVTGVAEAGYLRREELNVSIPAEENRKALTNLKWALALAVIVIISLFVWGFGGKNSDQKYLVEKDVNNNLIIHADNPDEIGSVTVVPK